MSRERRVRYIPYKALIAAVLALSLSASYLTIGKPIPSILFSLLATGITAIYIETFIMSLVINTGLPPDIARNYLLSAIRIFRLSRDKIFIEKEIENLELLKKRSPEEDGVLSFYKVKIVMLSVKLEEIEERMAEEEHSIVRDYILRNRDKVRREKRKALEYLELDKLL